MAVISGLRELAVIGQLHRYGVCLSDFFRCRSVLVIISAVGAVPVFDITLDGLGRRLCREVLKVGMIVRSRLAVLFPAVIADCFVCAGSLAACMPGEFHTADVANMVFGLCVGMLALEHYSLACGNIKSFGCLCGYCYLPPDQSY